MAAVLPGLLRGFLRARFFFYWRYTEVLAPLVPKTGPLDTAKYERAVDMLALGNAVPFVGPLACRPFRRKVSNF